MQVVEQFDEASGALVELLIEYDAGHGLCGCWVDGKQTIIDNNKDNIRMKFLWCMSLFDYEKVLVDIYSTLIKTDSSYPLKLAKPIFNTINMDNSISQYNNPEVLKASVNFLYFNHILKKTNKKTPKNQQQLWHI